jgi:hypothetical protein
VVQHGDSAKLPRRRRLGAARGAGTRLLLFGGWDGTHTCADLIEVDTSGWLKMDASQLAQLSASAGGGSGAAQEVKAKRQPSSGSLAPTGVTSGAGGGGA